jgi:aminopeptidase YwaD
MNANCLWIILFVLSFSSLHAQKFKKGDKAVIENLKSHVTYLADDKLEGRRAGTNGEKLAADYIRSQFEKAGLAPKGEQGTYFQPFEIADGKNYQAGFLFINDQEIRPSEYFPLPNSPEASLESAPSIALKESGVPWFVNMKEELHGTTNVHFSINDFVTAKAKEVAKKGAKSLFVYDSEGTTPIGRFDAHDKTEQLPIPVFFISPQVAKKHFSDEGATLDIKYKVKITEQFRNSRNVIGYLDNGAANTVVLGAHYDHLGFGEDGTTLQTSKQKQIHNGADDNASGVAGLIELARLLKTSKLKNNNYLFIAFSGEESGLLGSRHFINKPTVNLQAVNYMINMDMIGRLNETNKTLTVGGYGTSPLWSQLMGRIKTGDAFTAKYDSSGAGPSDHTSFYRKDIPVLFFFTGVHPDYHKPGDDADKINYTGEYRIIEFIYRVIEAANNRGKFAFLKTREAASGTIASFSVGLGIMPDYSFSGSGVRIDGISEGRAAEKAGLKSGDIVIQLGNSPVSSLENYMQALGTYKKGDKTKVKVKRASQTIEAEVVF